MSVRTGVYCDDCDRKAPGPTRPHDWGGSTRSRYASIHSDDYCPECTQRRLAADWPEGVPLPEIGQDIYIGTSLYIDHGEDDVRGGLAKINGIEYNPGCGNPTNRVFVTVAELPGRSYNYLIAMQEYDERKASYGENRAYPDPDYG
jgi:hypothetical protein